MRSLLFALFAVGLALTLPFAFNAMGQQQPTPDQPGMTGQGTTSSDQTNVNIIRGSDVMGLVVRDQNNEKLGKIDNLAIDQNTGRIRYVVVSFGSTLGFGGKLLPVPWQAVKTVSVAKAGEEGTTESHCVLNISKEELAKAPGFQQGQWPDFSNQKWVTAIDQFYRPYVAKRPGTYTR
ncbi:MAG: PRC-barrel domain-containing protein [Thermoguttaceae bacterium]